MISPILWRRKCRKLTLNKVACLIALCTIVFNEFLVYSFQAFRWPSVDVNRESEDEMVVLFASDPQLIGIQDEIGFPVGPLARWDSDRYLRKTFSRVFAHVLPDVVIFMGDIMDEGSKATEAEYDSYLHRFRSIFPETAHTKTIVLPGDNDIGGEGMDFRSSMKMSRFEKHFESLTGVVNHNFIDFMKLDLHPSKDKVQESRLKISAMSSELKAPMRVLLNHDLILHRMKVNIYPILKMAQTNMLFSGHWHVSEWLHCKGCLSDDADPSNWPVKRGGKLWPQGFTEFDLGDPTTIQEIMVPTCSYRMGVPNMGYGIAVFKKSGSMRYTVLWQPSRYKLLYIYLAVLPIVAVLLLLNFILTPSGGSSTRAFPTR